MDAACAPLRDALALVGLQVIPVRQRDLAGRWDQLDETDRTMLLSDIRAMAGALAARGLPARTVRPSPSRGDAPR